MRSKNSSRENLWGTRAVVGVKKKMEMDGKRCERGGERVICIPTEGGEVRLRRSWRRGEEKINWGGKSETEAAK